MSAARCRPTRRGPDGSCRSRNTTFYATPARDTAATWAQQTNPGFRIVVKQPKLVTHERRFAHRDAGMGGDGRGCVVDDHADTW